jgi:chorismate synthase
MNKFGNRFSFTTFGESHGKAIGCVVDGVPAGLIIDREFIQSELDRRRPGKSNLTTSRKEPDSAEILSGVFEEDGVLKSTGTPIAFVIYNTNQKSKDYNNIKDIFRPGHADYTYWHKYGIRDYRGGGRSSARESAARVAAGAIAKLMLKQVGVEIKSGVYSIAEVESSSVDFEYAKDSEIFALDSSKEQEMQDAVLEAKNSHDSVGGVVLLKATGVPVGLGEPMYHKLDGEIGSALLGLNAVKAVEIGEGVASTKLRGSQNNDEISNGGFKTNHSGGILGGISNGNDIDIKVHFKPTPSIFIEQDTTDIDGNEQKCSLKGRHDPCVAIRGSVVCESMLALILADMLLLNATSKMDSVMKIYQ